MRRTTRHEIIGPTDPGRWDRKTSRNGHR